jgi:hypothetical protein
LRSDFDFSANNDGAVFRANTFITYGCAEEKSESLRSRVFPDRHGSKQGSEERIEAENCQKRWIDRKATGSERPANLLHRCTNRTVPAAAFVLGIANATMMAIGVWPHDILSSEVARLPSLPGAAGEQRPKPQSLKNARRSCHLVRYYLHRLEPLGGRKAASAQGGDTDL